MASGPLFSRAGTPTHRIVGAVARYCSVAIKAAFEVNAEVTRAAPNRREVGRTLDMGLQTSIYHPYRWQMDDSDHGR